MVFLDTNIVTALTRQVPAVTERNRGGVGAGNTTAPLGAIVLSELDYRARKGKTPHRNLERIRAFLAAVAGVAAFDAEDAAEAGDIRAYLEARGTPVGANDLLIAAQTRRRGSLLVTNNRREFDRVPGLLVTDWGAAG